MYSGLLVDRYAKDRDLGSDPAIGNAVVHLKPREDLASFIDPASWCHVPLTGQNMAIWHSLGQIFIAFSVTISIADILSLRFYRGVKGGTGKIPYR